MRHARIWSAIVIVAVILYVAFGFGDAPEEYILVPVDYNPFQDGFDI